MFVRHALIGFLLAATVLGQAATPDTPAGSMLRRWIDAFNAGDVEMRAFNDTYRRTPWPVPGLRDFRQTTGGFTLLRVEKSEQFAISALLEEKNSDLVMRLDLALDAADPAKITDDGVTIVARPLDLTLARTTEAEALKTLSARADRLTQDDQFSGAVLVSHAGTVVTRRAWGLADRDAGTPATPQTRFRLASVNKMFTAVAALQLAEGGKIALDDPVGKYLSNYPNTATASSVTIRHLLTHTGGTGDIFGPEFDRNRTMLREPADYIRLYGSRSPASQPGATYRYSNYGYVLLGAIIEKVSGLSYYDYLRTRVFQPAGMTSTDSLPEAEGSQGRAVGYMRRDEAWVSNADTLPWRASPAGGGHSTVDDLLRFVQSLETGALLSRTMLAEATRLQSERYGFGFQVQGEGPLRNYGHDGDAPGMSAQVRVYPQLGYVLVALSNLDPPAAGRVLNTFALRMPIAP